MSVQVLTKMCVCELSFIVSVSLSPSPQIVSAVQYCHQKCIVHRDLKVRTHAARNHTANSSSFSSSPH